MNTRHWQEGRKTSSKSSDTHDSAGKIPWPSVVNILCIMGSKVGSNWTNSWGRLLTDSSIVLIARKQPTAARAPGSSTSSSASAVFMHLQNAAACCKKENDNDIKQIQLHWKIQMVKKIYYQMLAKPESIRCHFFPKLVHNSFQSKYKVFILNFIHKFEELWMYFLSVTPTHQAK